MPNDVINTVTIHGTTYGIGGSGGHTIKNPAGTAMTQRSNLQFVDLTVSDDSTNDVTKVENIHVIQSESELENLPDGLYMLNDDEDTVIDGNLVGYDNTTSGLNAENVQDAIDEVAETLDDKIDISAKGVTNGVAELDENGKVPSSQLPSYVDDVIEVADYDHLPATGETGKIYVTLDTNKTYRWGGTEYVEISESLALGETSSTAYRGDRGKTAYDHSQLTSGNPHNVTKSEVGLGNVDNTSDSTKKTNFTGSLAAGDSGFVQGGTIYVALNKKADTITNATNGNLAGLNASGNLTDSGWNGAKDTTSISGNPISISGLKANQLAKDPIITLEPIQDLHGQSKPYPNGGSPTNLLAVTPYGGDLYAKTTGTDLKITTHLPEYSFNNARTLVYVEITTAWRGRLFATGKLAAGTYFTAGTRLTGTDPRCTIYVTDADLNVVSVVYNWQVAGGQAAQQITVTANQRIAISVSMASTGTVSLQDFFVGTGSGSGYVYSPFENICPISGYDKVEVLSCGKNLFDKDSITANSWLSTTTGLVESANASYCVSDYIMVKANQPVVIPTTQTSRRWFYDKYKNPKTYLNNDGLQVFTPTEDGYIRVTINLQYISLDTFQIEFSNQATTYVPYNKAASISESLGQTVYGGTLDVRTGKLTVTHKSVKLNTLSWTYYSQGLQFYADISDKASGQSNVISSIYKTENSSADFVITGHPSMGRIHIRDTQYNGNITNWLNAMGDQTICYKLATPFTIQLTPHEISLLKDYAYISTNGTSIYLDYHNGELASLADVSQLGETVNELGEYINRVPKRTIQEDITSHTGTGNEYDIPCDGYITLRSNTATSGRIGIYIYGNDSSTLTHNILDITGTDQELGLFVKKNMKCRVIVTSSASAATVIFRGF